MREFLPEKIDQRFTAEKEISVLFAKCKQASCMGKALRSVPLHTPVRFDVTARELQQCTPPVEPQALPLLS